MVTTTSHGAKKYTTGEQGWGVGFNINADLLEGSLATQEEHDAAIAALEAAPEPTLNVSTDQAIEGHWQFNGGLSIEDIELVAQGAYQADTMLPPVTVTDTTTNTVVASYATVVDAYSAGDIVKVVAAGTYTNGTGSAVTITPTLTFGSITSAGAAGTFPDNDLPYQWRLEMQMTVSNPELQEITARLVVLKDTGEELWQARFPSTLSLALTRTFSLAIAMGTADEDSTWVTTQGQVLRTPPSPGQVSPVLWWPDYDSVGEEGDDTVQGVWFREQEPNNPGSGGTIQTDRITIIPPEDVPGTGNYKPLGNCMKVMLQRKESSSGANDGDVQGGSYNRSEVYDRYPSGNASSTPPEQWPDPVGAERWYAFSLLLPTDHEFDSTGSKWFTFTQWKQFHGGSPTLAMEINRSNFRIGGTRQGSFPAAGAIGAATTNVWNLFVVGIKWSTSSGSGWIEAYRNGAQVMSRQHVATMDKYSGVADPIYLKQGIYRTAAWTNVATLYFGPTVVGRKKNDVLAKLPDLYTMP